MKHLIPKLFFIAILVLGISSFVALKNSPPKTEKADMGNTRFNSEMDNGFADRETQF
jgi:hypothetical protein